MIAESSRQKKRLEKQKKEKEKQKKNDGMGCIWFILLRMCLCWIFLFDCFLCWCRSFFYFLLYAHKQVTASSECSVHSDKIITREARKRVVSISHIKDVGIAHFALLW